MHQKALSAGNRPRFAVLDGMRGVAAVFVILDHLPDGMIPSVFPGRYLAVDLFFLLSGFVIAHSYGDRLRNAMSVREFMLQRLVRLYPLYSLGMVLGLLVILPHIGAGPSKTWTNLAVGAAAGVFFLPTPAHLSVGGNSCAFGLNCPSWSLFFELIANVLFALVVPYLSTRRLVVSIAGGAMATAVAVMHTNTLDLGWSPTKAHLLGGLGRSILFFFGGAAIYRIWRTGRFAALRLPSSIVFICLAIALTLPRGGAWHGIVALMCASIILPVLVFAGAQAKTNPRLFQVYINLGMVSYAFYILQGPIIEVLMHFLNKIAGVPLAALGWMGAALVVAVVYIGALAASALFDIPVRRWLRARVPATGRR